MKKRLLILTLVLFFALTPLGAMAQGPTPGGLILGRDLVVTSGEVVRGNPDTVVLGGDVRVEQGGRIIGDLAVIGGDTQIAGQVEGDLLAIGGDIQLGAHALINGDVFAPFGQLQSEEGAQVQGQVIRGPAPFRRLFSFESWPQLVIFGLLFNIFRIMLLMVGLAAAGLVAVALLPKQTYQVRTALLEAPTPSLGVGCLSLIATPLVGILLFLTCLGIPVAILLFAVLIVALVFGWIAAGVLVGERLLTATQAKQRSPVLAVTLGTLLITLVSSIPCFGTIFGLLVAAWGLGAVLLTRFGTKSYNSAPPPQSKTA